MSVVYGKLVTCSRCGATIFLKYLRKGDTDGGYTKYDIYEELPEDWLNGTEFGDLCPECTLEFKTWVNQFFNGKVCYKWKLKDAIKPVTCKED